MGRRTRLGHPDPPCTDTVPEQQFDTVASLIAEQIGVAGPWVRVQDLLTHRVTAGRRGSVAPPPA